MLVSPCSIRALSRWKSGRPCLSRDEFAVELNILRQRLRDVREQLRHVPTTPTPGAEAAGVGADEAAEAVELRFERPAGAGGDRAGTRQHRFGQPQTRGEPTRVDREKATVIPAATGSQLPRTDNAADDALRAVDHGVSRP